MSGIAEISEMHGPELQIILVYLHTRSICTLEEIGARPVEYHSCTSSLQGKRKCYLSYKIAAACDVAASSDTTSFLLAESFFCSFFLLKSKLLLPTSC
jgi:hypothetical protein